MNILINLTNLICQYPFHSNTYVSFTVVLEGSTFRYRYSFVYLHLHLHLHLHLNLLLHLHITSLKPCKMTLSQRCTTVSIPVLYTSLFSCIIMCIHWWMNGFTFPFTTSIPTRTLICGFEHYLDPSRRKNASPATPNLPPKNLHYHITPDPSPGIIKFLSSF